MESKRGESSGGSRGGDFFAAASRPGFGSARLVLPIAIALLAAGCTPSQYARQADRTAYAALSAGQRAATGQPEPFEIGYNPFARDSAEANVLRVEGKTISLAGGEPAVLSPRDCLLIAFRNARDFQARKESLYASALDLAAASRAWEGFLTGGLSGSASTSVTEGAGRTSAGAFGANASWTRQFVDGGALVLGASVDLASDLTGIANTTAGSLLSANFTQPLLRGAGRGLAYEGQYRLERNFLFGVYEFGRFQETFAVTITAHYYSLLQARDQLENQRQNLTRLQKNLEVARILVEGEQISKVEQDQSEQSVVDAQISLESAQQSYRDQLDSFKLFLGLPVPAAIELDYPAALIALNEAGPKDVPFDETQAIQVALSTRPDVLSQRAGLRDAERDVVIAADAFLPQLDVKLEAGAASRAPRDFWDTQFNKHTRGASVVFDYPLDQTDHRNAYRKSLIALERAKRSAEAFEDGIRLEVRQAHRALLQSRRSYQLQQRNVKIALRRTRLVTLQRQAGQASARDVLDAEAGLLSAKNGLTSTLIAYNTTRMQFLASLGMLRVEAGGRIDERDAPFRFDLIGRRYPYLLAAAPVRTAASMPAQEATSGPSEGNTLNEKQQEQPLPDYKD
jgi:outer membrane protein TolC